MGRTHDGRVRGWTRLTSTNRSSSPRTRSGGARPTPAGVDERSLRALAAAVAARAGCPVRIAHLDHSEPSIHTVLDEITAIGVGDVLFVPLAISADRYLVTWMARAVANWRETRGAGGTEVRVADGLITLPAIADAVAGLSATEGAPITASPAAFRSPAWSVLEIPDRHLPICRGPRCTVYGAGATHRALATRRRAGRPRSRRSAASDPATSGHS